jgi:hypothetical protein
MASNRKVISIASDFSITNDFDQHELAVFATAPVVISLPSAVAFTAAITAKAVAGAVALQTQRGETIDGSVVHLLEKPYAFVRLLSDGSNWQVVAN